MSRVPCLLVGREEGRERRRESLDASKRVPSPSSSHLEGRMEGGRLWTRQNVSRVPRLLVSREEGRERRRREGGKEGGSGHILTCPESLVLSAGRKGGKEGGSGHVKTHPKSSSSRLEGRMEEGRLWTHFDVSRVPCLLVGREEGRERRRESLDTSKRVQSPRLLVWREGGGREGRREALDASKRVQNPSSSLVSREKGRERRRESLDAF